MYRLRHRGGFRVHPAGDHRDGVASFHRSYSGASVSPGARRDIHCRKLRGPVGDAMAPSFLTALFHIYRNE
jgi:hypothetical protein